MRYSFAFVFLALTLGLQGCAYVSSLQSDVTKQVETLEEQQEYGRALEVLALIPSSHPEYKRLSVKRIQIEAKAKFFEQSATRRAEELMGQNRWAEAENAYRQSLEKLPHSQALRTALQEFRRKQAQRVEELKVDQLVGRARFLERALPIQENIVSTDPGDASARRELERLRSEAMSVSNELTRVGLNALDKNSLGIAGRTLPIAARLNPSPAASEAKEKLGVEEAAQVREQREGLDRLRQQETQQLLAEFRQAFQADDLRRARLVMTRLQELDGKNPEIVSEQARLKARTTTLVKKHMADGVSLYGRGKFQDAINSWNKVLELDPDNEQARSSLERAGRVVEKLKQLREKQSPTPKAAEL